ncbi:RagB/SusD family nutrient uptake outer membrane protein [Mangrovibacterium diazotrophicum]|uniref:Putative outer membrane starch-binding protein n=1 Tax=Mangrovibacterium diazotrophicum TaxID=1261403 RepID=A0A419W677_9BACT|nr:RagB/SusD family nutrient uptake outer membrane protein [Mangrovibacterium diazotrophicum]RKD90959.1 putative outer membrane starch-binding protein [Mangrovibacterium diazotrophicum]
MKKIKYLLLIAILAFQFTACNDWLTVLPENEQVSDEYWTSKEEVESVLAAGYVYLRDAVPYLVRWGELRGAGIYTTVGGNVSGGDLQTFQVTADDTYMCTWAPLYKVINMSNSVIANAETVLQRDATFDEAVMNSYLTEAYFLRALSYFYIVRNWRDAPLITEPYETDKISYEKEKSTEAEIIAQIKEDISTALATGAAKEKFEEDWATKGRATKWALHALMADVCLWNEEYETAVMHCNEIIDATSSFRPVFVTDPTKWYELYYPGNSNGSIFEINWDQSTYSQSNSLATMFGKSGNIFQYTDQMLMDWIEETDLTGTNDAVRTMYGGYVTDVVVTNYQKATTGYVWKYSGIGLQDQVRASSTEQDPNFIVYRMADVMLMKAEALISVGTQSWQTAIDLINTIRTRSNLPALEPVLEELSEADMLELVLHERNMELAAEGKRWYDLLRLGKRDGFAYRDKFLVNMVVDYNNTANPAWIRSVLNNDDALYLPIETSEIENNRKLVQNPYYQVLN